MSEAKDSYKKYLSVGDLVYFESTNEVGIILKVAPVAISKLIALEYDEAFPPVDIKVLWENSKTGWCLGESVIVLSHED